MSVAMNDLFLAPDPGRSVLSRNGAAVAGEPLAASAGLWALAEGGNAVDAALAMAAVTGVTMPEMCGLGADAFALVYDARTRTVTGFGGSGGAPLQASEVLYRQHGHTVMPFSGWWSVSVPGAVDVYVELHRRWGQIPLERLWAPAIRYARDGFPIGRRLAKYIALETPRLKKDAAAAAIYLAGGEHPAADWILKNPDLARTFEEVIEGGEETYYRGDLARRIVQASEAAGGLFTPEDFARFKSEVYDPPSTVYRGHRVYETKPPSQGLLLLEMLNLIEAFDFSGKKAWDPEVVHLMAEAKKVAFADRNREMGDPLFIDAPTERLISKAWADKRRADIDPDRADNTSANRHQDGDTTSLVAVDGEGNAVSFIHSNSALFGSAVVVPGTGMVLNNRAGRGFRLDASHPNGLAGGKRTMHTLNTYLVMPDAQGSEPPLLVGNTPGGDGQPQWNLQTITNVVDFGLDAYEAVAAPRWTSMPGTDPISLKNPVTLRLEGRFPESARHALEAKGHTISTVGPWDGGGSAMLIRRLPDGTFEAAADPRDGGQALGI